jgi:hypothetical protein
MLNLIIPSAGKSSRFSKTRPKWLLTNPNGNTMIKDCLRGINMKNITNIYITILKEHFDKYLYSDKDLLHKIMSDYNCHFLILDENTTSQCETVIKTIEHFNISGPIFIKDVDNYFNFTPIIENQVCYLDINYHNVTNLPAKSFIKITKKNKIKDIQEKKIISDKICVGGYSFKSAKNYIDVYKKLKYSSSELYTSHLISHMIKHQNTKFMASVVTKYEDWGTYEDWLNYKKQFKTLFLDIDGCIFKNTGEFTKPSWGFGEPLENNIKNIQEQYNTGKIQIILTTSRKEKYRTITIKQLQKYNVPYNKLIMELQHSTRYLINDFSETNPFPSAVSINIRRNDELIF